MISDDELLQACERERRAGIGLDQDDDLADARQTALNYAKGEMPDVPSLANRSKAVSTDVSDAVETALPDLMEIFIGGDDIASFQARSAEDEEQAKIETEAVLHVVMEQNPAFEFLSTGIKDALLTKLGVFKVWTEDVTEVEREEQREIPAEMAGMAELAAPLAQMMGAQAEVGEPEEEGGPTPITMKWERESTCIRIAAWPSEDFGHARDARNLRDAVWFGLRSRPRAQRLLDDGFDPQLVDLLHDYSADATEETGRARDTASENDETTGTNTGPLRTVEIVEHYIRIDADEDGKSELWRVVAGNQDKVLLEKEKLDFPPVAVITPYLVPHRLLGRSLADLLLEIQRIKTALLRMLLDSGYFALNQRFEVAMAQGRANQWTLSDLMRNTPNMPVRSESGDAVRPLGAGGLSFDAAGALEYMSTVAENRTGIVRNAQGLNPDTLHDTAAGAAQLIGAAQKRVRFIARTIAETGIKDLFLIVHQMLRKHGDEMDGYSISRPGTTVNPKSWRPRKALSIDIGVGSGGREHDIAAGAQLLAMQQQAVQGQGGLDGPLTTAQGIKAAVKRQTERLGFKNADQYWPEAPPPDPNAQPQVPPEVQAAQVKSQSEAQIAQQKIAAEQQSAQMRLASEGQITQQKMAGEAQLEQFRIESQERVKMRELELADQFKRDQAEAELALRERELAAERDLKLTLARIDAVTQQQTEVTSSLPDVQQGGEPG